MSNVVNLQDFKNKPKENPETSDKAKDGSDNVDFEAIEKVNKVKVEKLARERAQANENVKRSYRLRPKDPNNKR